jgi:hypothetical protein
MIKIDLFTFILFIHDIPFTEGFDVSRQHGSTASSFIFDGTRA